MYGYGQQACCGYGYPAQLEALEATVVDSQ